MKVYDLIVIGGGPGGLAAAYYAKKSNVKDVLILERDIELGGILNQCIHSGFGLHIFNEELTGPEYADRFIKKIQEENIDVMVETMVLEIEKISSDLEENTIHEKIVKAVNPKEGYMELRAKAVIIATGCRERVRGAVNIGGDRPSGIFTAGAAQKYINTYGYIPGNDVLILGSGDIGLIMARRMALEGADVKGVVEVMPYSNGLQRNIVQCLEDFNIPLYLSHTVVDIIGEKRLEKVIIAEVDKDRKVIKGTEKEFDVDTLLLSVGLICENGIANNAGIEIDKKSNSIIVNESMETSMEGVFTCGNVLHVHDIVDFVTLESKKAGEGAAKYINRNFNRGKAFNMSGDENINYIIPHKVNVKNIDDELTVFFRVNNKFSNKVISVESNGKVIYEQSEKNLIPAAMIKLNLKKDIISSIEGDIVIHIKEKE